jgi:hypothetical protein
MIERERAKQKEKGKEDVGEEEKKKRRIWC